MEKKTQNDPLRKHQNATKFPENIMTEFMYSRVG